MSEWFRVTFVAPTGYRYETTGQATSPEEAVHLADEMLEHVERIGIRDFLNDDGVSVRPPSQLTVEVIDGSDAGSGFGLVITAPDGRTTRK